MMSRVAERIPRALFALWALLLAVWIIPSGASAYPWPLPTVTTTSLPILPYGQNAIARDGGASFTFAGESVFTFGDTPLDCNNADGTNWVTNTMYHTPDADAANGMSGGYNFPFADKPPIVWIPFTQAEVQYNQSGQGHVGLWPTSPFKDPHTGKQYLWFAKVLEHPGAWWDNVGTGFVEVTGLTTHPLRLMHRPGQAEDHILFASSQEGNYGDICVVHEDYVYAFYLADWGTLRLARAPLANEQFKQRENWEFRKNSTWVTTASLASTITNNATAGSIEWNDYLHCWLYTHMQLWGNKMMINVADNLWGPWSAPVPLYTGKRNTAGDNPYFGRAHKILEKEGGRTQFTTYSMPPEGFFTGGGVAMVKVRFHDFVTPSPTPTQTPRQTPTPTPIPPFSGARVWQQFQ